MTTDLLRPRAVAHTHAKLGSLRPLLGIGSLRELRWLRPEHGRLVRSTSSGTVRPRAIAAELARRPVHPVARAAGRRHALGSGPLATVIQDVTNLLAYFLAVRTFLD